jgi:hypothetical protein
MNKLDPKVAGAFVAVLVIIAGIVIFKSTVGSKFGAAPPIAAGGPASEKVTLPGGSPTMPAVSGANGSSAAPPMAGTSNMSLPGGSAPMPGGGSAPMPGGGGGTGNPMPGMPHP